MDVVSIPSSPDTSAQILRPFLVGLFPNLLPVVKVKEQLCINLALDTTQLKLLLCYCTHYQVMLLGLAK
jgi:hypothetical protein